MRKCAKTVRASNVPSYAPAKIKLYANVTNEHGLAMTLHREEVFSS
jgi:hypothetical protein